MGISLNKTSGRNSTDWTLRSRTVKTSHCPDCHWRDFSTQLKGTLKHGDKLINGHQRPSYTTYLAHNGHIQKLKKKTKSPLPCKKAAPAILEENTFCKVEGVNHQTTVAFSHLTEHWTENPSSQQKKGLCTKVLILPHPHLFPPPPISQHSILRFSCRTPDKGILHSQWSKNLLDVESDGFMLIFVDWAHNSVSKLLPPPPQLLKTGLFTMFWLGSLLGGWIPI